MINRVFGTDYKPLPVYPVCFCSRHMQEDVDRPVGVRDFAQILLVLEGVGTLYCDGKEYPLQRGTAFYVAEKLPHAYKNQGNLITAWVGFRGEGLAMIRAYTGERTLAVADRVNVKRYVAMIEQMEQEYFSARREGVLSSMTYALLLDYFEALKEHTPTELESVLRYMEQNFHCPITLESLADFCHISRSSFCKKFKDAFGCTAFEKLLELRLSNAASLLAFYPNEKVGSIAAKCGFDDVGYFCKAFKKRFGKTPSELRAGE